MATRRPSGRRELVLTVLGAVLVLVSIGGCAARHVAAGSAFTLGIAAATPYLLLAAPAAATLFLIVRQWIGLLVATVSVFVAGTGQVSLFIASDPPAHGTRLVVMTANLHLGEADADAVVKAVRRAHPALLMLQELTPDEQDRLAGAGLDELLPHRASQPREAAGGTGLWSRYPLTDVRFPSDFNFALVTATASIPGLLHPLTAVALHLAGPVPAAGPWRNDIHRLPALLHSLQAASPVVVGGDFNATPDTVQFRRLLTGGFRDAADQAGAGITATYPADRWFPPLIAIDHVLTRDAVATAAHTVEIAGSDHRALVTTVDIAT